MVEQVNHPKHYGGAENPYEAIKVIEAWSLGFCLGNTVKYISARRTTSCRISVRPHGTSIAKSQTWSSRMEKIKVLDHGFVRLIDSMGNDLSIVRAARVSYDAAWRTGEDQGSDDRLIRYLWKNRHTTPFEAVTFTFEVKAPIFVFRQWHRHCTWSFNELSARYRELPEEFYLPDAAMIGEQSAINKQGRQQSGTATEQRAAEVLMLEQSCIDAFATYKVLLDAGWPRELARSVLPVNTYSHMFATVDLRNLLHFLSLRVDPHAQHEIRVYAKAMRDLAYKIVPAAMSAWEDGSNG